MITVGSQRREPIEETEYKVIGRIDENEVVLEDASGKRELWVKRDDYSGYVIVIDGIGYEFVRSALMGDEWWTGLKMFQTPA